MPFKKNRIRNDETRMTKEIRMPKMAARRAKRKLCSGRDLNAHAFRHTHLKRTCRPFQQPSERLKDIRWKMGDGEPQAVSLSQGGFGARCSTFDIRRSVLGSGPHAHAP